ncbi:hypothetical protein BBF96_03325 [Anoxybacter fermentans]|uniref:Helix-turn-helix domain-containing protein n=1 Tax=Anoxybacter fermentans TaxID=1323375 RepID=A0A3S9SW06_9FIRM|nr:helix-turn-helix domain-containing protein [Anoxybacter fermentans]AZR72496.1 hypothetical protein BBF96_03325 [Anoxybacter fermentans]
MRNKRKETMTAQELADLLGIKSVQTVYKLLNEGKIPGVKVGHQWVIPTQAILDWLYVAALGSQKRILEHIGVDFGELMDWIAKLRHYENCSNLDNLVKMPEFGSIKEEVVNLR